MQKNFPLILIYVSEANNIQVENLQGLAYYSCHWHVAHTTTHRHCNTYPNHYYYLLHTVPAAQHLLSINTANLAT
jgi:hypothetical protein